MKTRRVIVSLELETDAPIRVLKKARLFIEDVPVDTTGRIGYVAEVVQVQANVVRHARGKKP